MATSSPEPVTVQEAIRRVSAAVGAVGKNKRVEQGPAKYAYRGIDDILEVAHPAMAEHGLVIAPRVVDRIYEPRSTRNGGAAQFVVLFVEWTVIGPDGSRLEPAPLTVGEAVDTSDKATNKAHTAAWKLLLSELLALPYSEPDHDADRVELGHRGQQPQQQQQQRQGSRSRRQAQPRQDQPQGEHREWTPPDPWPIPDAAAVASMWGQLDQGVAEEANRCADQLENLPPEMYAAVLDRMTSKAGGYTVVDITSLPPSWLPTWASVLTAAWRKVDAAEASGE